MPYVYDKKFDVPWKMIEFFLTDQRFRTNDKYNANSPGKGGMIFRGQSDSEWKLQSSAFRKGSLVNFTTQPLPDHVDVRDIRPHLGRHLLAEAKAISTFLEAADSMGIPTPLDYATTTHGIDLIMAALNDHEDYDYTKPFPTIEFQRATALAQHHGVPTRFLDWSESPLVACYFAAFGASSFSADPRKDQELSVVFVQRFDLLKPSPPVDLIMAPRHENANLLQQQGVFTNIKCANQFFLDHGEWPVLEDFPASDFQLLRVRLPAHRADALLRELFDLKITRHSMMPSLSTAARANEYAHVLFSNAEQLPGL